MPTLRDLRLRRYLTQKELGELLGVSEQTIVSWETARRAPRLRNIRKLAEVFEVSPAAIEEAVREQERGELVA